MKKNNLETNKKKKKNVVSGAMKFVLAKQNILKTSEKTTCILET